MTRYLRGLDPVECLVRATGTRILLAQKASALQITNRALRKATQKDEEEISLALRAVLASDVHRQTILELTGQDAQDLLNLIHANIDKGYLSHPQDVVFARRAHKLVIRLSVACGIFPSSLLIDGVTLLETESVSGGAFADIYRATYNGQQIALKRLRVWERSDRLRIHRVTPLTTNLLVTGIDARTLQMICQEALLWRRLQHPYVLPFIGVDPSIYSPSICLASPWMENGTILSYMTENGVLHLERHLLEIAQGLEYLHNENIVHGDLRGANILVDSSWHARIADFGLSVLSEATINNSETSNSAGAARWMAPELHDPEAFDLPRHQKTKASDVYAFGCTCLELYSHKPPFHDVRNPTTVVLKVLRGERPTIPASVTRRMRDIIQVSWSQNHADRPMILDVISMLRKV
ncbi:hypothetical protein HGRIS_011380 [Hohenbuehelia grisea]|uniref:Protein kinase domain-containing protein n=1 Tax=Hohenbuehelia grisea TaxID=104357 RepID=A0ABR3JV39_9AGAR